MAQLHMISTDGKRTSTGLGTSCVDGSLLDAEALLTKLRSTTFRLLANYLDEDLEGLSAAARLAFKRGQIDASMKRRLEQLDTCVAWLRHASTPKAAKFQKELGTQLARQSNAPYRDTSHSKDTPGPAPSEPPVDPPELSSELPQRLETVESGLSHLAAVSDAGSNATPRSGGSECFVNEYYGVALKETDAQTDSTFPPCCNVLMGWSSIGAAPTAPR